VRLGGQLLEEEIPDGPGTCSLLEKGEWINAGKDKLNSSHPSASRACFFVADRTGPLQGKAGEFFYLGEGLADIPIFPSS
jgi:hypothetical protein